MLFPDELDATVIYYAQVTDDEDKLRPIESPILGLFAAKDISMKVKSVEAFGAALERLRKDHEIHVYPASARRLRIRRATNMTMLRPPMRGDGPLSFWIAT